VERLDLNFLLNSSLLFPRGSDCANCLPLRFREYEAQLRHTERIQETGPCRLTVGVILTVHDHWESQKEGILKFLIVPNENVSHKNDPSSVMTFVSRSWYLLSKGAAKNTIMKPTKSWTQWD